MIRKLTTKLSLLAVIVTVGLTGTAFLSSSQASAATPKSLALVAAGKEYIGTPYKYGAPSGITKAFDCSSFVQYVFGLKGITLPRSSVEQAKKGESVKKSYLSVGDLIFYNTSGDGISHVAIYAGAGKILHASSSGVTVSDMNMDYWASKYVTARRIL